MFKGLSAFPITPFKDEKVDFYAFERLMARLTDAKVNSVCAMGSTGLYPYLNQSEFADIARAAVNLAEKTPVLVGIGALRTQNVLRNAEIAEYAGVDGLLLAPVSYHRLHDEEVYSLYEAVCAQISIPLCIYENPSVTGFTFSDELYKSLGDLPNVAAIKVPGAPFATAQGETRLASLKKCMPCNVAIGVSGDQFGIAGMAAGCDVWLSVVGGLFPNTLMHWITLVKDNKSDVAQEESDKFALMWDLFVKAKGGLRVMATAATILGLTEETNLPFPLKPLNAEDRKTLESFMQKHQLC